MDEKSVDREIIEKPDKPYQPWTFRWSSVKQHKNKKPKKIIDIEKCFNFDPIPLNLTTLLNCNFMLTKDEF